MRPIGEGEARVRGCGRREFVSDILFNGVTKFTSLFFSYEELRILYLMASNSLQLVAWE